MTSALALLLSCVAGAALLVAAGMYFWVNRTPPENERFDKFGRVPLFGVDLSGTTPAGTPVIRENAPAPVAKPGSPPDNSPLINETAVSGPISAVDGSIVSVPSSQAVDAGVPSPAAPPFARPLPTPDTPPYSNPAVSPFPNPNRFGFPLSNGFANGASANGAGTNGSSPNAHSNGDVNADGVPGSMIEGHALRFSVPAQGTLQFLPGRFEINSGLDSGREIRFVRVPGPDGTQVTFGRNEGPLYRHIQLRDQTVSREHARMTLVEGQWSLANLSRTNPVAHNGRILGFGESQLLHDGDRVEMGEVVFNFRSR